MRGISSSMLLNGNLSQEDKEECLRIFISKEFLAYNYQKEDHEDPNLLLSEKYLKRKRYSLRYKTEDFVISCSVNNSYLTYLVDGDNEHSKVILDVSDDFASILTNLSFSYIDGQGDSPDSLDNTVEDLLLDNLFKYNYFGSGYIEKYGKEFFENFPADQVRFITDSVVRVDLVDDLFDSISEERQEQVRAYLALKGISEVEFYDSSEYSY